MSVLNRLFGRSRAPTGESGIASLREAFVACEQKDYAKARNLYRSAVKQNHHSTAAWFNLGVTELRCRNWSGAAQAFSKVVALGEEVLLGTFAKNLCLTELGSPLQWPRQFDKDPAVIGLGGPAKNLAHELANRGYDVQFRNEGRHCEITLLIGDSKYRILLDCPVGTALLMSWGFRSPADKDDWTAFCDLSQCPSPTDTDREMMELMHEYPTLRLAQMPIAPGKGQ